MKTKTLILKVVVQDTPDIDYMIGSILQVMGNETDWNIQSIKRIW